MNKISEVRVHNGSWIYWEVVFADDSKHIWQLANSPLTGELMLSTVPNACGDHNEYILVSEHDEKAHNGIKLNTIKRLLYRHYGVFKETLDDNRPLTIGGKYLIFKDIGSPLKLEYRGEEFLPVHGCGSSYDLTHKSRLHVFADLSFENEGLIRYFGEYNGCLWLHEKRDGKIYQSRGIGWKGLKPIKEEEPEEETSKCGECGAEIKVETDSD